MFGEMGTFNSTLKKLLPQITSSVTVAVVSTIWKSVESPSIWAFKSCCATLPSMKSSVPISRVATDLCRNKIVLLTWIEPKQIRAIKGRHNANSTVTIPLRWFGFFDRAFRRRNLGWQNIGWNFENEREEIIRRFHFRTLCQETSLGRENSAISSRTGSVKNNDALLIEFFAWRPIYMAIVENMPEARGTRNMWNVRHSPKRGTTTTP